MHWLHCPGSHRLGDHTLTVSTSMASLVPLSPAAARFLSGGRRAGAASVLTILLWTGPAHAIGPHRYSFQGSQEGERLPAPARLGYLGVSLRDLDAAESTRLSRHNATGAMIVTVDRDAPAWTAGLRPRDVIVEFNGQPVDGLDMLRKRLRECSAGESITLRIQRGQSEMSFSVTMGDQDAIAQDALNRHLRSSTFAPEPSLSTRDKASSFVSTQAPPPPAPATGSRGVASTLLDALIPEGTYTGLEVDPLSPQLAFFFGVHAPGGLLVTAVNANSPAAEAGLTAGDVIVRARSTPVSSRGDLAHSLHEVKEGAVPLAVLRNHQELTVNLLPRKRRKL